jgi:hypothetical protein
MSDVRMLIDKFWRDVKEKNVEPNFQKWLTDNPHLLEPVQPVEEISGPDAVRDARSRCQEEQTFTDETYLMQLQEPEE